MSIKIALAGNPNCGKTTLFNALTGSNQFVGNWPGVTVEKKEGKLKWDKEATIMDLPGIYSMSPYTNEEIVSRTLCWRTGRRRSSILQTLPILNATCILPCSFWKMDVPMVIALNMMDEVRAKWRLCSDQ